MKLQTPNDSFLRDVVQLGFHFFLSLLFFNSELFWKFEDIGLEALYSGQWLVISLISTIIKSSLYISLYILMKLLYPIFHQKDNIYTEEFRQRPVIWSWLRRCEEMEWFLFIRPGLIHSLSMLHFLGKKKMRGGLWSSNTDKTLLPRKIINILSLILDWRCEAVFFSRYYVNILIIINIIMPLHFKSWIV